MRPEHYQLDLPDKEVSMDIKVLNKLYKTVGEFVGQELVNVAFLKKTVKNQDILVAELTFKDKADVKRTAVFVLDQKLTEGNYKEIAEGLTQ